MEATYLSHLFPKGLLDYFELKQIVVLCDLETKKHYYEIYLEEKNIIIGNYDQDLYESKGFTNVRVQDFPLRGNAVYLLIKRRRWRLKKDKTKIIRNDFAFVAANSGFTQELSDFLKGRG